MSVMPITTNGRAPRGHLFALFRGKKSGMIRTMQLNTAHRAAVTDIVPHR